MGKRHWQRGGDVLDGLLLDRDWMDAQFLTKPWAQVPWQVLAVIDRAGTQAANPGHLFQQVGDIPVEVQVPQVCRLDMDLNFILE